MFIWFICIPIIDSVPTDTAFYSIMSSGEQDSYSRGFSISLQDEQLHMSIVNGLKYWRVSIAAGEFPVGKLLDI